MKSTFLILLIGLLAHTASGQLVITAGGQLSISGNVQVSLQNTNFINNGNFSAGTSRIRFTGNSNSNIDGNQPIQFHELELNKSNNASVQLQRSIGVQQRIVFNAGFLNLNSFNTDLGSTGQLQGEQASSRITGSNGGQVTCNVSLNAPSAANPGNLGAVISSSQNLGNVIIRRGHNSPVSPIGSFINRYYDIQPANNTNLNDTLRFNYFDEELNGNNEGTLIFFKTDNNVVWSAQGFTTRSAAANYVEKTGIPSFARWTLSSSAAGPLPVQFSLFNLRCEGNKVVLVWKTAQEQNSQRFDIEKSSDGANWTVAGSIPAAGNSTDERSYSFTDNNPGQNSYYRIAEYDIDGKKQYTSVLRSSCASADVFRLWPNPANDVVFVSIKAGNSSMVTLKLMDSKGALVKMQKTTILQGSNQLKMEIGSLARGVYTLRAEWDNGQEKKAVQVLKQ